MLNNNRLKVYLYPSGKKHVNMTSADRTLTQLGRLENWTILEI